MSNKSQKDATYSAILSVLGSQEEPNNDSLYYGDPQVKALRKLLSSLSSEEEIDEVKYHIEVRIAYLKKLRET